MNRMLFYYALLLFSPLHFLLSAGLLATLPGNENRWHAAQTTFDTTLQGRPVRLLSLENGKGMRADITNYGARIVGLWIADRTGKKVDVILGFNHLGQYLHASSPYYGAVVGRYAGRIAKGEFTLNGKKYLLDKNSGGLTIHGGSAGFHQQVWQIQEVGKDHIRLGYLSKAGEAGFPGNLAVSVEYRLTKYNQLVIHYTARTDAPTVLNITNHSFFNLNGEGDSSVLDHVLTIRSDIYWPLTEDKLPGGRPQTVAGTPFDFNRPAAIRSHIGLTDVQLQLAGGFDHTYILHARQQWAKQAVAVLYSPSTGIQMKLFTQQPAVQLFTANFLNGKDTGRSGKAYERYSAVCLETQHFPNSPNRKNFPTTTLYPGAVFENTTIYAFSTREKNNVTSK